MRLLEIQLHFLRGSAAVVVATLAMAGCQNATSHPDEKQAVTTSLNNSNQLGSVSVSQDRDNGVITLTGNVASDDLKAQAESRAKQGAPDYAIANEIGVRPPGDESHAKSVDSSLDSAIEDNFKVSIKGHTALDKQSIHFPQRTAL